MTGPDTQTARHASAGENQNAWSILVLDLRLVYTAVRYSLERSSTSVLEYSTQVRIPGCSILHSCFFILYSSNSSIRGYSLFPIPYSLFPIPG